METMALGRVCTACHTERKKKNVKYDPETFLPYCDNPYICNTEHPNAPKNMLQRGSEVRLLAYDEAQDQYRLYLEKNLTSVAEADKIRRMLAQPTTVRIQNPELALFILEYQREYNFPSISDAIRDCIRVVRENKRTFYTDYKEQAEEKQEQEEIQAAVTQPAPAKEGSEEEIQL